MQMWVYIVRRLLLVIPVVLGVMTITFILVTGIPTSERCLAEIGAPPTHGGAPALAQVLQPLRFEAGSEPARLHPVGGLHGEYPDLPVGPRRER